jgi:hypothetical protein
MDFIIGHWYFFLLWFHRYSRITVLAIAGCDVLFLRSPTTCRLICDASVNSIEFFCGRADRNLYLMLIKGLKNHASKSTKSSQASAHEAHWHCVSLSSSSNRTLTNYDPPSINLTISTSIYFRIKEHHGPSNRPVFRSFRSSRAT